ncbi:MAG: hypothetical protein HYR73_02135 [Candidatus Eisenbacteria bacterium]|nr:hypothetical protein [Candidatus Eisenbacteria bacterium]
MRLRAGFYLCLFAVFCGIGCRKPITPADNNQAPETWITSAPQDTITVKDKDGHPIVPSPGTIPVLYHLYWAGSDIDGAIAGYYYALVETAATAPPGFPLPGLPGPKPRDYHFTTHTDMTFIFTVTEAAPDRQHAFFIYAVDNKGKPDPTPARFIFNSQDRYPPAIDTLDARATSPIFCQSGPGAPVTACSFVKMITDSFDLHSQTLKDTVPSSSVLNFHWHSSPTLPGSPVTGYQYKLDETQFVPVDSSVHSVTYNSGITDPITGHVDVLAPGPKQFTLRALDLAGGARQTTRRFLLNISPITWLSGPDPNAYPYTHRGGEIYLDLPDFAHVPNLTGSLLSNDSVQVLPSQRPERRTFFEIYKNRIYVRGENDTVNFNSWVVVGSGGFDPDTPYLVKAGVPGDGQTKPDTSGIPPGSAVVLHSGPANGSPIGFKGSGLLPSLSLTFGSSQNTDPALLYPNFDPNSTQRLTIVSGYFQADRAGKAYCYTKAVDGYVKSQLGSTDDGISSPFAAKQLADKVDAGGGTDQEKDIRRRIITFYIDKVPYLVTSDPTFTPKYDGSTVYPSRTLNVNLFASDVDPYTSDVTSKPTRVGGPSTNLILRWTLSFAGKDSTNQNVVFAPDFLKHLTSDNSGRLIVTNIVLDPRIIGPAVTLKIELCDCIDCEIRAGSGRCVNVSIPFMVPPPPTPAQTFHSDHPGPGSSNALSGRDLP